jgi:hypothetical protein
VAGVPGALAPLEQGKRLLDLLSPSSNKGQHAVDTAAEESTFQTTMHRLIVTDPIISEHDPNQVAELANTIRAASPDAARDINFMRFALREALQYDGVPTHTYADILGMQQNRSKTRDIDFKHKTDAYRV